MPPVLMEVPPSPSNISRPTETTDESQMEQWIAIEGGGFAQYDGVSDVTQLLSRATCSTSTVRKTIRKAKRAKAPVEYYVNHCENTACSFPHGHAGLCSHQIVIGKRGSRPGLVRWAG